MKDEIKEINIKFPGQILDYVDTKEHLLELFNYIINLQEENDRLKKENIKLYKKDTKIINELKEELQITQEKWDKDKQFGKCRTMEMLDYKSRNEKYKKVINEIKEKIDDYFGYDYENESQARLDTINEINNIIVDLYNGGDEEC